MTRGYVILAQNTESVDYIKCAKALSISIKNVMPNASVSLITNNHCDESMFDYIIDLPHGDLLPNSDWKLINDWQIYEASPYDETIKLEADMFLPRSIEHWWETLSINNITVCSTIRNFKNEISDCRVYRKFIDDNHLPDVYNGLTYFKKSKEAETFFKIVRDVFENWENYKSILICNKDDIVTTDWAYAIACHILGIEKTTLPNFTEFSFTHMKRFVNDLPTEDWTDSLLHEHLPHTFRVQTYTQLYPFHYHNKSFSDILLKDY